MPEIIPCLLQPELTDAQFRKNCSRLIQKVYEVDPLTCLKCQGKMRAIAFKNRQDLSPMPRRGLNPRHTTIPSILPPRITSPIRSIPWMLASKKPVDADPPTYAQIDQNNGLLPITLRLTAQPTLDN
jgi:hypothetical protein